MPSAGYQYTFEDNTQWTEFYASGQESQNYLVHVATKYGIHQHCRFNEKFQGAKWLEEDGI